MSVCGGIDVYPDEVRFNAEAWCRGRLVLCGARPGPGHEREPQRQHDRHAVMPAPSAYAPRLSHLAPRTRTSHPRTRARFHGTIRNAVSTCCLVDPRWIVVRIA